MNKTDSGFPPRPSAPSEGARAASYIIQTLGVCGALPQNESASDGEQRGSSDGS